MLWGRRLVGDGIKHLAAEDLDQLQGALCPKDAVRVFVYMARHQLPSRRDALLCAAQLNDVAVLDLLLAAGTDPNAPAYPEEAGWAFPGASLSPLHAAAK